MKYILRIYLLLSLIFPEFYSNAQAISQEMLEGPTGYFKTYDDFLHNNFVPFTKPKFSKRNTPQSITFHAGKSKTTFGTNEIWGYRFKHILFRVEPSAELGILIVVAVGDMILYESYHSPQIFISEDGRKASYAKTADSYYLNLYVSKDLNSEIVDKLSKLHTKQSDIDSELYISPEDIGTWYLTYASIFYECRFPGYRQVNYGVNQHSKNNDKQKGH